MQHRKLPVKAFVSVSPVVRLGPVPIPSVGGSRAFLSMATEPPMLSITSSPVAMQSAAPAPALSGSSIANQNTTPFASALAGFKYSNLRPKSAGPSGPRSFDSVNPPVAQKPLGGNISHISSPAAAPTVASVSTAARVAQVISFIAVVPTPQSLNTDVDALSSSLLSASQGEPEPVAQSAVPTGLGPRPFMPTAGANVESGVSQVAASDAHNPALNAIVPTDSPFGTPAAPGRAANASLGAAPQTPSGKLELQLRLLSEDATRDTEADAPEGKDTSTAPGAPSETTNADTSAGDASISVEPTLALPAAVSALNKPDDTSVTASKGPPHKSSSNNLPPEPGGSGASGVSKLSDITVVAQQPATTSTASDASPGNQQDEVRQEIALEITARVHSSFGDFAASPSHQPTTAIAVPDGAIGAASDPLSSQFPGGPNGSSGSSGPSKPADSGSGPSSGGHLGGGDGDSQNGVSNSSATASAATLANTATILNAPADASRHATTEVVTPPASSVDSSARSDAPRPSSAELLSAQQTLPAALPSSLGDVVQASRLYQRVGGAEMHIAMDTDLLGSIDLRAIVHQSGLTATIGVQHADVQALLSSELPGLQHALSQKNLHVEQISIFGSAVGSQSSSGGSQQQKNNPSFASQAPPGYSESTKGAMEANPAFSEAAAVGDAAGRLSIHV